MDEDPVVRGILKAICLKRIRPGTKLGEDQLVEAFGTNRMHIRHALAHLGSRNVITLFPNRGAYVARPSVDEAHQVFATRRVLEQAAVSGLIDTLTDHAAKELRRHVDHEAARVDDDRWGALALTGEFHTLIARLSGNAVLTKFLDELVHRSSLIIASYETQESLDCAPDAHLVIATLILARDKGGAIAAMEEHLNAMERRLRFDVPPEAKEDIVSIFAHLGVARSVERQATK